MSKEIEEEDYIIEQFKLEPSNFKDIASLIRSAFIDDTIETGGTIAFDAETFHFMYGSPVMPKDIFVKAISKKTGEMVGFLGGIPRDLSYKGQIYKFAVPSWASVHSKHTRHGLAVKMGLKLLEIGKEKGFEGGIAFFEPEAHGIDAARSISRKTGIPMIDTLVIKKFIIRIFDIKRTSSVIKLKAYEKIGIGLMQNLKRINNPRIRKFQPSDAETMFELMKDHVEKNELSVVRNHDDFVWYVQQPGVNCVVHENENGKVDGFILAWKFDMAGFGKFVPFGWLDLVHTYRLAEKDSIDLCKYLCITSKELGWAGLQCPFIPYFDVQPFKKAKFIFFPKTLIIGLFPLKELPIPNKVNSFYFDWR